MAISALDSALKKSGAASAIATIVDRYLKGDRRLFQIGEPCSLLSKARKGTHGSEWYMHGFIGEEMLRLETAYITTNEVMITASPNAANEIAHVRIPLKRALKILEGFETSFNRWLDENDDGGAGGEIGAAIRQAEMEDFEQRKRESGDNPDFGTW